MPRIPVYEQQVAPGQMPGPRLNTRFSADAFDGGMAESAKAMSGALQVVNNEANKILQKKNAIWVQERLAKLAQNYDTYTYGSPDGQVAGVLTSKGLAASKAAEGASQYLDGALNDLMADAPSQDAVAEFRARATAVRSSTASTIARHAATELNRYHAEAAEGNAQVQMESIAADYNQPAEALEQAFKERVAPSLADAARLTGKPVEEVMRGAKATMYSQVITQSLAEGNTRRASELMGKWSDDLDAKTRAALTDKIRTETIKIDADEKSMFYAGQMESGRSYSSIVDEINGIADRDMKMATRSAFRAMATQIRYERSQAEQEATFNAYMGVEQLAGDLKAQYDYVNSLPKGTKAYKQAMSLYSKYAAAEGRHWSTDPEAFTALAEKITFADITDEKALLASPEATKVSAKDMKLLKKDLDASQTLKVTDLNEMYLRSQGGKKVKDKADQLAFVDWARKQAQATNRANDPEYVQGLADQWFLKGEKKGGAVRGFFGDYGPDEDFRKSMADPTWLPQVLDDDEIREGDRLSLTQSTVQAIQASAGQPGGVPADLWQQYMQEAGNDAELAARKAWKAYLSKTMSKRKR